MAQKRKKRRSTSTHTPKRRRSVSGVHHHPKRRRRVSGVSSKGHDITEIAATVGGAIIARVLAVKLSSKANPKIIAGGQIALGFFAPKFSKNIIVKGFGKGMMVNGALSLLNQFGVIGAIGDMVGATDEMQLEYLSGTDQLQSLAGEDEGDYAGNMGLVDDGTMSGGTDRLSILAGQNDWETELGNMELDTMSGDDDY